MDEEPTLPELPKVSWNAHTESFTNTRKRYRESASAAPPVFSNSSDPAVFSSDDDPHVDNYAGGRHRKKRYVGSWFQQVQVPASSDSTFSEPRGPRSKPKRTFERQVDSGVWMGSDASVELDDRFSPELEATPEPRLPQLRHARPRTTTSLVDMDVSARIDKAIEMGEAHIDLSSLGATYISNGPISRLAELELIPSVHEDAPFEPKTPDLGVYMSSNQLVRAPSAVFSLEHLTYLSLRTNQIDELPPSIGQLRNLRELNLSSNRLRHLPGELLRLLEFPSALRSLRVHPNPFYRPQGGLPLRPEPSDTVYEENRDVLIPRGSLPCFEGRDTRLFVLHSRRSAEEIYQQAEHFQVQCAWQAAIMARSPVQYSDSGGSILSKFQLPCADTDEQGALETEDLSLPSVPRIPGRGIDTLQNPSRVLSLFELALKSASRASQLWDLASCLPPQAPASVGKAIERISSQREVYGTSALPCSTCGRQVIVPTAQWIEWWDISSKRGYGGNQGTWALEPLSMDVNENAVPFLKRGCSWKCVPRPMEVGQYMPGTLRFQSVNGAESSE